MSPFRSVLLCMTSLGAAAILAASGPAMAFQTPDLTGEESGLSDSPDMEVGPGTPVLAAAETVAVGTAFADAADDPAIWVDRADPSRAVIFGTDKKAGLYAYNLDGSVLQSLPGGNPNNVDVREGFVIDGRPQVLVAASDRSPERFGVTLFVMDPATLQTRLWGVVASDLVEPYGLCMGKYGEDYIVILNGTDGQVRQMAITVGPDGAPVATEQQRYGLSSQTEGCVIDERTGYVYIGEEAKGVWRYSVDPARNAAPPLHVAVAPSAELVPDVEGLALLQDATGSWLMVSSQGDSAFSIWKIDGEPQYRGRFSVIPGDTIDAVTGTDGIAALSGPIGSFAEGLVVVQDDIDLEPGRVGERQNFKLVDWTAIRTALGL